MHKVCKIAMYNIDHLQTFNLSGKDYYMEVDAMDKVHFYPKENLPDDFGKNSVLTSVEESLFNLDDAFIDKSVEMNLSLNNRYFSIYHHNYSGIKISIFNKKDVGKLSSISLLFINNQRKLIFDTSSESLIISAIAEFLKKINQYSLSRKEKLLDQILINFSI